MNFLIVTEKERIVYCCRSGNLTNVPFTGNRVVSWCRKKCVDVKGVPHLSFANMTMDRSRTALKSVTLIPFLILLRTRPNAGTEGNCESLDGKA